MATTTEQLTAAHQRTIEALTGKKCQIILHDKQEMLLQNKKLTDILLHCESHNKGGFSIISKSREPETIKAKKLFCLIADKAGYSANKIGAFLGHKDHTLASYHIKKAKELLSKNKDFQQVYDNTLHEITSKDT